MIITADSYETKITLLNTIQHSEEFSTSLFHKKFEQVQSKFFKYVLNINRHSSNHAIRAKLGEFPLSIVTSTKLIKYWHRLENLNDNSLLKEAFDQCKDNNHS